MGETQYEVTHMLSRHETLKALFAILEQAYLADTDQALHWQDKRHVNADDLFGHVRNAIEAIEPPRWSLPLGCETGRIRGSELYWSALTNCLIFGEFDGGKFYF